MHAERLEGHMNLCRIRGKIDNSRQWELQIYL